MKANLAKFGSSTASLVKDIFKNIFGISYNQKLVRFKCGFYYALFTGLLGISLVSRARMAK